MSHPIHLSIKMFGAFRKYHPGTLDIQIPPGSKVLTIKSAIGKALHKSNPAFLDDELINKSALANNQRVFKDDDCIEASSELAILPPVCGG